MADTMDSSSQNSDDHEQVMILTAEPRRFTITGESRAWGFRGEMDVEVSHSGNTIKISTFRYKFSGINQSRNPMFKILCPTQVELLRVPLKDNQWHNWVSYEENLFSQGTTYRFSFTFDAPPSGEGPTIFDSKSVTFATPRPPQ